ncbi:Hypothetical_protein [Hexamita inflata]|uniref:Hypothetical_protein n=1 Tax=Hexamita inflata TaxID=28002 RepID=A0AA86TP57_9EUKA|nr:Hypothetical protein HINF_LOCUS10980 [Hexamita inflata]
MLKCPIFTYLQKFVYKGITVETIDKVFILSQKGINQTQIATETGLGVMQVRRVVQRAIKDEGFYQQLQRVEDTNQMLLRKMLIMSNQLTKLASILGMKFIKIDCVALN